MAVTVNVEAVLARESAENVARELSAIVKGAVSDGLAEGTTPTSFGVLYDFLVGRVAYNSDASKAADALLEHFTILPK